MILLTVRAYFEPQTPLSNRELMPTQTNFYWSICQFLPINLLSIFIGQSVVDFEPISHQKHPKSPPASPPLTKGEEDWPMRKEDNRRPMAALSLTEQQSAPTPACNHTQHLGMALHSQHTNSHCGLLQQPRANPCSSRAHMRQDNETVLHQKLADIGRSAAEIVANDGS